MVAFFKKFKSFVPVSEEEAPGELLPDRPDISLGDVEQPASGGGEFEATGGGETETPDGDAEGSEAKELELDLDLEPAVESADGTPVTDSTDK